MLNSDDDKQFETYLKNFRPVAATAMPETRYRRSRSFKPLALWGSIAVSVASLIMGIVVWHFRTTHQGDDQRILVPVSANSKPALPPLTIGSANRWMGAASSIDTALDDLAFRAKNAPFPAKKESAIAVLREENNTL